MREEVRVDQLRQVI